jgi:hypothetical protein
MGAATRNANEYSGAEERAQELLRSWLSPDQRRQYEELKSFDVVGGETGKRYRIHKGESSISKSWMKGVSRSACCV